MKKALLFTFLLVCFTCCKRIPPTPDPEPEVVNPGEKLENVVGVYVLNESNMGNNKATLDYYDYETGEYYTNIFLVRNPQMTKDLGDVGNDLQIYGSKMYAVINCSNVIEVMNAENATHEGEINIPNCRYIVFNEGFAYVSSYAGPVEMDPNARRGYVAKIDTATLQIVDTVLVGYQPEQMVVTNGKLYVANSGGYMAPNYDNRVSVINLATFTVEKEITVAPNLHRMSIDNRGHIFVSSRGNYNDVSAKLFVVDSSTDQKIDSFNMSIGDMTIVGDTLYAIANDYFTGTNSYSMIDLSTMNIIANGFITDGTESQISVPYGLAVNPDNGDIFVTDAKTYVVPGVVYCFNKNGKLKFSIIAGEIPAHFAFLKKETKQ
ncbi:MAG: YncE family protein [Bacteroidales bacterium]|nr:YncE family protein [Bacteroidales bacterium]